MKKTWIAISLLTLFLNIPFTARADNDLESLKQRIKECTTQECKEQLQKEAETIFEASGRHFDDDFAMMASEITVNHCRSIIEEMFYHIEKLKSYHNFRDVFYLNKLKKMKKNREQFERKKITTQDFDRINHQIEVQYQHDIQESQDFIDEKVQRLRELCNMLTHNMETIQANLRIRSSGEIPQNMKENLLDLKNEQIWLEFSSGSKEGEKIKKSIRMASRSAGEDVITCLMGTFARFDDNRKGSIFSRELLDNMDKNR